MVEVEEDKGADVDVEGFTRHYQELSLYRTHFKSLSETLMRDIL